MEVLFSFLEHVNRKGYVAVDFYDGSIMYDFENHKMTLCDIDLFRKAPAVNDMGEGWHSWALDGYSTRSRMGAKKGRVKKILCK